MTVVDYGPAGNTYDKFNSKNPISRYLMAGFLRSLRGFLGQAPAQTVLEVGCGEGYIQQVLSEYRYTTQVAFDIDAPIVHEARQRHANAQYLVANGEALPFERGAFGLVMAIEVLEHVPDPSRVLAEMARVSNQYVLVSVPREPIWRVLNMARGKYWGALGNTPGHVQHWSSAGFVRQVAKHLDVVAVAQPLPWTMVLAKVRG
jgi:ubiquinone/menaquinone biosynthesis C-methylase UbiE